ncbi:MAG TPA: signal peptidase II [Candidatus Magasanikbacteria bacterium]|nr:signal peptidase II [Candidatus Magasanikbacteria bacterium]
MKKFTPMIIGSAVIGADWLLKFAALSKASPTEVFLFNGIGFTLVKNQGIAFGIVFNQFITVVSIFSMLVVIFFCAVRAHQKQHARRANALLLIFMGGASNAADRLLHGFIVDYIHIFFWPVFNLADALIVCSVIYLIFRELKEQKRF